MRLAGDQSVTILKQAELGMRIAEQIRIMGVSE
jgi:hypothetical protein